MSEYQLVPLVALIVLVGIALYLHLPPRRPREQDRPPSDQPYVDAYRDDERNWLGGFIYNNPDDPNLFVPKRYGLGWTINFGNPQGKALMIGLLLLIVVLVVVVPVLSPGTWGPTGYHPSGGGLLP